MKKLCLILLLIPLLLCGCKKEPQDEVQPYYGEFFTQDGIAQNTGVVLLIQNETLVAPVTELSYALYDYVDFTVEAQPYHENNNRTCRLEVYKDGAWQEAAWYGSGGDLANRGWLGTQEPTYRGALNRGSGKMYMEEPDLSIIDPSVNWEEKGIETLDLFRETYYPLEAGIYRLRVKYYALEGPEGTADTLYEAVAYFTVTAE